jgi:hypothetical protein
LIERTKGETTMSAMTAAFHNRHAADELADVRAELKHLQVREAGLRATSV